MTIDGESFIPRYRPGTCYFAPNICSSIPKSTRSKRQPLLAAILIYVLYGAAMNMALKQLEGLPEVVMLATENEDLGLVETEYA